ncbi:MAG: Transposase IS116/IS110/IS902 family protein [Pelotomaculum sp. PtaU1.Bin065]|nr:MAG: Transposase IS116/IS110/IS902 family protein [Pelotomaculum sp. PtaU1.Bin065]
MEHQHHVFIGVDTHKDQHTAVVCNCWHKNLGVIETPNNPVAFPTFLEQVLASTPNGLIPVFGLEDTGGLGHTLAVFLLKAGYVVKEVNSIRSDRQRNRSPHPDKSDPDDAKAVAKVLINDFDELPDARADELPLAIAQLVHHREHLVNEQTRVKNRFHAAIHQQYADYREFFKDPFGHAALAFWHRFPSSEHLKNIGVTSLASFLRKHSNNRVSTRKAERILSLINRDKNPSLPQQTRDFIIRSLVERLWLLEKESLTVEERLALLIKQTGLQLETMDGINTITAAALIADIRDISRFASSAKLARYAGVAPLKKSSGQKKRFKKSKGGRRSLNTVIYQIALNQICLDRKGQPRNHVARNYFLKKVAEGKTKKEALTCLMRRLCDIIFVLMRDKCAYSYPQKPDVDKASPAA